MFFMVAGLEEPFFMPAAIRRMRGLSFSIYGSCFRKPVRSWGVEIELVFLALAVKRSYLNSFAFISIFNLKFSGGLLKTNSA